MDRGKVKMQLERLVEEALRIAPSIDRFENRHNYGRVTDEDLANSLPIPLLFISLYNAHSER